MKNHMLMSVFALCVVVAVFWVFAEEGTPESVEPIKADTFKAVEKAPLWESEPIALSRAPVKAEPVTSDTEAEVSVNQCLTAEFSSAEAYREKEAILSAYLQQNFAYAATDSDEAQQFEKVILAAGLPIYETRMMMSDKTAYKDDLTAVNQLQSPGEPTLGVSFATARKVAQMITTYDYPALANAITAGDINPTDRFLVYDLLTLIFSTNPQISPDQLRQLRFSGIPVTLSALVQMTTLGASVEQVSAALEGDVSIAFSSWRNSYQAQNLLLLALNHRRFELAKFWFEQGVPVQLDTEGLNVLDVVSSPAVSNDNEFLVDVMRHFASNGMYPHDLHRLKKLQEWLPKDVRTELNDYFEFGLMLQKQLENDPMVEALRAELAGLAANTPEFVDQIKCMENIEFLQAQHQKEVKWGLGEAGQYNVSPVESLQQIPEGQESKLRNLLFGAGGFDDIVAVLQEGETELPEDAALIIAERGDAVLMQQLMDYGLDMSAIDERGNTVWHYAVAAPSDEARHAMISLVQQYDIDLTVGNDIYVHALNVSHPSVDLVEVFNLLEIAGAPVSSTQYEYILQRLSTTNPRYEALTSWYKARL